VAAAELDKVRGHQRPRARHVAAAVRERSPVGCTTVIGQRLRQSGMHWIIGGAPTPFAT
jgi:hypothetical protein